MSSWRGGVQMEKMSTSAFLRGSGRTFRNCHCHDLLETLYFWTLSPDSPPLLTSSPSASAQPLIMPMDWILILDNLLSCYLLEVSMYPSGWIWNSTWPRIFLIDGRTQNMILYNSESLQIEVVLAFSPSMILTLVLYQMNCSLGVPFDADEMSWYWTMCLATPVFTLCLG